MSLNCQIVESDTEVCVICPEIIAQPGVPEQTIVDSLAGWNASAFSVTRLDGDVFVEYDVPARTIGAIVGLGNARLSDDPRDVPHGFFTGVLAGRSVWQVIEAGEFKTPEVVRTESDVYRIERRNGVVQYFVNGKWVYTSTVPSTGSLVTLGLLFFATDQIN